MKTPDTVLLPAITVHGRFQPPLHVNHWDYIRSGFDLAQHVTLLITNPYNNEGFDAAASWRNSPASNPFTFEDRKFMFEAFFERTGIPRERYSISPFNIKDPASFKDLDPDVPNLINVYSEWSAKKVELFAEQDYKVIRLDQPKRMPVSGTTIREIIRAHQGDDTGLKNQLIEAGFVPEAIPGLMTVLKHREQV